MFPRWLSWMFLLFMGYVLFSASQSGQPVVQRGAAIVPPITSETYPALAQATDLEGWKRKLNPDYAAATNCSLDDLPPPNGLGVKVIIDQSGVGDRARCGERIRLNLTVWDARGQAAFKESLPITLGARKLAAGMDYGALGMAVGEQRSLLIPPFALVRSSNEPDAALARALKALPAERTANVTLTREE